MRIGLYGGSFDPVHTEHVRLVRAAMKSLSLDKVFLLPTFVAPHKDGGAHASPSDRETMCRIAFRDVKGAEVDRFELDAGGTSYTYLTCRAFRERFKNDELFLLVGADMLENFFSWKDPESILSDVRLAACGRGEDDPEQFRTRFFERFHTDFVSVPFTGKDVSSTMIRVALAFRGATDVDLSAMDGEVLSYSEQHKLYRFEQAFRALLLEKESRRAHSYRVARLACRRARSLHIPEEKALVTAMLHDCAKSLSSDDPLLKGFVPPDAPPPVLHQYAGAYVAEHSFGIEEEDVLDAVRFHTTGRENMTPLGALLFLSDLLEEGRDFQGVEELRRLFFTDFEECMKVSLSHQLYYLRSTGDPVDPHTEAAFRWYNSRK